MARFTISVAFIFVLALIISQQSLSLVGARKDSIEKKNKMHLHFDFSSYKGDIPTMPGKEAADFPAEGKDGSSMASDGRRLQQSVPSPGIGN
ncbi:hypothetical protein CDL15_Pgr007481 [Punica granatum]|uniref:Uncharacterized protein n=1 Tax=Punica granatum TaxID=22663 RepID=A0A218X929_PUNGR|nr:hypothetical protein CDL15_Pgr007481 [Punica granatum]